MRVPQFTPTRHQPHEIPSNNPSHSKVHYKKLKRVRQKSKIFFLFSLRQPSPSLSPSKTLRPEKPRNRKPNHKKLRPPGRRPHPSPLPTNTRIQTSFLEATPASWTPAAWSGWRCSAPQAAASYTAAAGAGPPSSPQPPPRPWRAGRCRPHSRRAATRRCPAAAHDSLPRPRRCTAPGGTGQPPRHGSREGCPRPPSLPRPLLCPMVRTEPLLFDLICSGSSRGSGSEVCCFTCNCRSKRKQCIGCHGST